MARTLTGGDAVRHVQRRTVMLLSAAQVLGGFGTGATVSIGSILAVELSGSIAWAGAVSTVMTVGAASAALPLAALAERKGRRASQVAGLSGGFAGALLMVLAVVSGSFILLLLGAVGIGAGAAASLQARFAALDLADPEHLGRALSAVMWAVTIGAVAGPNLIQPGTMLGQALGLPPAAGPFVISGAGLMLAATMLFAGLRPDPLLLARELAGAAALPGAAFTVTGPDGTGQGTAQMAAVKVERGAFVRGMQAIRGSASARLAVAAVAGAQAMMVGVMSMTPLHLQHLLEGPLGSHEGHVASRDVLMIIGFAVSLHMAGMFALSPVMGWLTDKAGRAETIVVGAGLLLAAVAAAGFGQESTGAVAMGLVLLGMGWSAATVAGSALLAESVGQESRVAVQGVSDMLMGAAGAIGGAVSGVVLSVSGYLGLNLLAGTVGACLLAAASSALIVRHRLAVPAA